MKRITNVFLLPVKQFEIAPGTFEMARKSMIRGAHECNDIGGGYFEYFS
jgi:hypothetical protein